MDFAFTLFEPRKDRPAKPEGPLVEIRPNGRIVFNKTASELLCKNQFCMLGFDPDNKALGILPLPERKTNTFPVRYAAKGAYIGAKRFFKHFNILPQKLITQQPFQAGQFIGINIIN